MAVELRAVMAVIAGAMVEGLSVGRGRLLRAESYTSFAFSTRETKSSLALFP